MVRRLTRSWAPKVAEPAFYRSQDGTFPRNTGGGSVGRPEDGGESVLELLRHSFDLGVQRCPRGAARVRAERPGGRLPLVAARLWF